jgi:serine/threonine protein kinase
MNAEQPVIKVKNKNKNKKKVVKFVAQGTYGCVFHPGIKCGSKNVESEKYISKIQVKDITLDREIDVGKIVRKIPNYKNRFSPIMKNCNVDVSTIDDKEVEKCDVIMDSAYEVPPPRFVSSKMIYAGNKELGEYLEGLLTKPLDHSGTFDSVNQFRKYIKQFTNSHIYLLESIRLLNNANIVHYDLKQNNIIYNEKSDCPIIIDFGLSIQMDMLTPKNYKDNFYSLYEVYECWCVEILILCYISRCVSKKEFTLTSVITSLQELKEHITVYINENRALQKGILESERITLKKSCFDYINSFLGKSWQMMFDDLVKSFKSWDNYSLAVIFIKELYYTDIIKINDKLPSFLSNYIVLVKEIILSAPTKRKDSYTTLVELKKIFEKVNKAEYGAFVESSKKKMDDSAFLKNMKQVVKENSYRQLEDDDELIQRKEDA